MNHVVWFQTREKKKIFSERVDWYVSAACIVAVFVCSSSASNIVCGFPSAGIHNTVVPRWSRYSPRYKYSLRRRCAGKHLVLGLFKDMWFWSACGSVIKLQNLSTSLRLGQKSQSMKWVWMVSEDKKLASSQGTLTSWQRPTRDYEI